MLNKNKESSTKGEKKDFCRSLFLNDENTRVQEPLYDNGIDFCYAGPTNKSLE